jgi:hypothetical protein
MCVVPHGGWVGHQTSGAHQLVEIFSTLKLVCCWQEEWVICYNVVTCRRWRRWLGLVIEMAADQHGWCSSYWKLNAALCRRDALLKWNIEYITAKKCYSVFVECFTKLDRVCLILECSHVKVFMISLIIQPSCNSSSLLQIELRKGN